VIGGGDSPKAAIEDLSDHLEMLKQLPVHVNMLGFANLLECIKEAEAEGITFGSKVPKPESILSSLLK
jgi:hypothetical protein